MGALNRFGCAILVLCIVGMAGIARAGDAPTSQPVSSVTGVVTAESEVPLSEMVVYLESPEPGRAMPPTTQPVVVSQKDAQFEPRLAVITVGQAVEFPNDEDRPIEHNV